MHEDIKDGSLDVLMYGKRADAQRLFFFTRQSVIIFYVSLRLNKVLSDRVTNEFYLVGRKSIINFGFNTFSYIIHRFIYLLIIHLVPIFVIIM